MISLIPEYIPMQILVGAGIGLIGGLLAYFLAPLPIGRYPANAADAAAIGLLAVVVLLPVVFPMTLFLALALVFLTFWIVPPIIFSSGRKTVRISGRRRAPVLITVDATPRKVMEIRDTVDTLSPEGRQAMLEEMRIYQ